MNLSDRVRRLWALTDPLPPETIEPDVPVFEPEVLPAVEAPFLTFPCKECETIIVIQQRLEPGQNAVTTCDNCGESWTVVLRPCIIMRTEDCPEVWKYTSGKAKDAKSD